MEYTSRPSVYALSGTQAAEEVAPGVLLTTDDGASHLLQRQGGMRDSDFAFAPDGSTWLLHGSKLIRVRDEGRYPGPWGGSTSRT
jgi:hypothetical protein